MRCTVPNPPPPNLACKPPPPPGPPAVKETEMSRPPKPVPVMIKRGGNNPPPSGPKPNRVPPSQIRRKGSVPNMPSIPAPPPPTFKEWHAQRCASGELVRFEDTVYGSILGDIDNQPNSDDSFGVAGEVFDLGDE